jgi:serine-type D-Ala-D-Ala carboxypeptidase
MSQKMPGSVFRAANGRESSARPVAHSSSEVGALLDRGVAEGVFPGGVLIVSKRGEVVLAKNAGKLEYASVAPPKPKDDTSAETPAAPHDVQLDTVYDIGELTMAAVTIPVLMRLVQEGKLRLEDRVGRFVQGFGVFGKSPITVAHLLNHTSGLAGGVPFHQELMRLNAAERPGILGSKAARQYVLNAVIRTELEYPIGTRQVYSEYGVVLLAHLVEVLTGLNFERAVFRHITQPLGLKSSSFIDLAMMKRRGLQPIVEIVAPTELCPLRGRLLRGEVFDENAWSMGGIAGHAGLFSTAFDLQVLAATILGSIARSNEFIKREVAELFMRGPGAGNLGSFTFGWDTPSRENGMADLGFSEQAVGMNSATGCSLWLEPYEGLSIILLSNAVHPTRGSRKIIGFRQDLHRAILKMVR